MIEVRPDAARQRVVLREGSRILGELIYQVSTGGVWLSPVQFDGDQDAVTVGLTGGPLGPEDPVVITDRFVPDESSVTLHRSWRLPAQRRYRIQVDFRSYAEGPRLGVLPAVAVCDFHDRSPSPHYGSPVELLSIPGAVVASRTDASALLLLGGDLKTLAPSIHIYESEHRQAIQVQCPGINRIVRSQLNAMDESGGSIGGDEQGISADSAGVGGTARLSFRLYLNQISAGAALLGMEADAWSSGRAEDQSCGSASSIQEYRELKLSHLNRHVHRDRRGVYGLRPARDDRRRHSPGVYSGLAPYWSLVAARAFAQEGRRSAAGAYLSEAREICRFFLTGKRSDGLYRDAFDRSTNMWGSVINGVFTPGAASVGTSASVGRLIAESYAELRAAGTDAVELSRAVGDLASVLSDLQGQDGLWAAGDALASAEVVSLFVRLEAIKGRNSLRRSVLKRAMLPLQQSFSDSHCLEQTAGNRDELVIALRSLVDLARYLKDPRVAEQCKEVASLLVAWVFSHQLEFPARSPAARCGLSTRGLSACGMARTHVDFEGLPAAYELARVHALTGDRLFATVANAMFNAHMQSVGGLMSSRRLEEGGQPAEVDYTHWSSRRRKRRSSGSMLGARIGQSAGALYAATLVLENYPEIANLRSSSS